MIFLRRKTLKYGIKYGGYGEDVITISSGILSHIENIQNRGIDIEDLLNTMRNLYTLYISPWTYKALSEFSIYPVQALHKRMVLATALMLKNLWKIMEKDLEYRKKGS